MTSEPSPTPPPFFVADHLALDFLNSVAAPWGSEVEWLATGEALCDWLAQAGALSPEAAELTQNAPQSALDEVATEARTLREWFRGVVARHAGVPLTADALSDLAPLNERLGRDRLVRQITSAEGILGLSDQRDFAVPQDLLTPIVAAMADLVTEADFSRIRNCEGPTCPLWFLDTTRNNRRRWCSMSVCGNRAKAAAFRGRKRGDGAKE